MNKKVDINYDLSLVIPFFNREVFVIDILEAIDKENCILKLNMEILFVDSNSCKNLINIVSSFYNKSQITINVLNTENNAGKKRNIGIYSAKSNNIICIDDDCIPGENFIKFHFDRLKITREEKIIYSGIVYFPEELCRLSNYYKFRNYRHRVYDDIYLSNKDIDFHNFITMNMSFKKNEIINSNLFFDSEYTTYGLEDTQFGLDAIKKGFALKTCLAPIIHQESTSIDLFELKIRNFAQNYFFIFYKKNQEYLNKHHKLQINTQSLVSHRSLIKIAEIYDNTKNYFPIIIKILKIVPFFLKPISFMIKMFLKASDKKRDLYFFWMYKLLIILTIVSTLFDKKLRTKNFI